MRLATAEAAAYVVSPAKATPIGYTPFLAGALVWTEATPEPFVVAVRLTPLSVKVSVLPTIATPPVVRSVAEGVIEAPGPALVDPP